MSADHRQSNATDACTRYRCYLEADTVNGEGYPKHRKLVLAFSGMVPEEPHILDRGRDHWLARGEKQVDKARRVPRSTTHAVTCESGYKMTSDITMTGPSAVLALHLTHTPFRRSEKQQNEERRDGTRAVERDTCVYAGVCDDAKYTYNTILVKLSSSECYFWHECS